MAEIRRFPFVRHLRGETTAHILRFSRGRLVAQGRGLAFWFFPMSASVAEVPVDDRDLPFLVHGRSADFQDVTVQGDITWRVDDPERAGQRVDFSLDLQTGAWHKQPLEQIAGVLVGQAQQVIASYLSATRVEALLAAGPAAAQRRLDEVMREDAVPRDMGLGVVSVRVANIAPTPELERALQTPSLERLQQDADEATFERRAQAVDKERAIAENELANQIELARREQVLITQRGNNELERVEREAASRQVEVEARSRHARIEAEANAERIRLVEGARVAAEGNRVEIYRSLPSSILFGMAAQQLAGKLTHVEHLNVTPELLSPLLTRLLTSAGSE